MGQTQTPGGARAKLAIVAFKIRETRARDAAKTPGGARDGTWHVAARHVTASPPATRDQTPLVCTIIVYRTLLLAGRPGPLPPGDHVFVHVEQYIAASLRARREARRTYTHAARLE